MWALHPNVRFQYEADIQRTQKKAVIGAHNAHTL